MSTPEEELRAQQVAAEEARMVADGIPVTESIEVDYFAFDEHEKVYLPDGSQFVEIKALTEGEKRLYQNALSRDARIQKTTGDTMISLRPGDERATLLKSAIAGWNLRSKGRDVPFTPSNVDKFLNVTDPKVIDVIEKAVRSQNSWLLSDFTVEDIDKQIVELQDLRAKKVKEEEGNGDSSSK